MKNKFIKTYLILGFIFLFFTSCKLNHSDSASFSNKPVYDLEVGDTLLIYYSTNSCCAYCAPNQFELEHLTFIEDRLIIPYPAECDGCDYTSALVFIAQSKGKDTLLGKLEDLATPCEDTLKDFNFYIVNIR